MPITVDTMPTRIRFYYQDFNGVSANHSIRLGSGFNKSQLEPLALALAQAIEPTTDCQLNEVTITIPMHVEWGVPEPAAGSDVSRAGVFILESTVAGERFVYTIPGILPEKLMTSGPWADIGVNLADPDIAGVVDLLLLGDGTVSPISYQLNDLFRVSAAYRQHRGL